MKQIRQLPIQIPKQGWLSYVPSQCAACNHWPSYGLCKSCYAYFEHSIVSRCYSCAIELPSPQLKLCGLCLKHPFAFDATIATVSYLSPWKELIHGFKFTNRSDHAKLIAQLMYMALTHQHPEHLQKDDKDSPLPPLLLPVPLSPLRMRERGYNQAWELCKQLSKLTAIPTTPHLLIRANQINSDQLNQANRKRRERFRALKGAFELPEKELNELRGRHVVLVDDVMTTGATLHHAALTLKKAGVKQITSWVFARTPVPQQQC